MCYGIALGVLQDATSRIRKFYRQGHVRMGKRGICFADLHTVSSYPWLCGTNARAYIVQVSDQRGTCIVDRLAKGGLCPVSETAPINSLIIHVASSASPTLPGE